MLFKLPLPHLFIIELFNFMIEQTGTGFIRVANEGNGYNIRVGNGCDSGDRPVYKSNPATNDWIPSVEYDQVLC